MSQSATIDFLSSSPRATFSKDLLDLGEPLPALLLLDSGTKRRRSSMRIRFDGACRGLRPSKSVLTEAT